jgi:hypothetical protein
MPPLKWMSQFKHNAIPFSRVLAKYLFQILMPQLEYKDRFTHNLWPTLSSSREIGMNRREKYALHPAQEDAVF